MDETGDRCVEWVIALERRSLQPSVRASVEALDGLLDPDFREIGASGRLWTREQVMEALTGDVDAADTRIRDEDMEGSRLGDHFVLLTYVSDEAGRRARRGSLWRFSEDLGWRLLYHQGTLLS